MIDPIKPDYDNIPGSSQRPDFSYGISENSIEPYVSIITPFYNTGEIFYETASSILNQSFQQFEWIIINDCSDHSDSIKILNDFRDKDVRIKVVDHESNRGLSAARNTGFRIATTNYILQNDSDDLLEETALEKWLWFLVLYPQYSFCKGFSIGFGAEQYLWEDGFINGRGFLSKNLTDATCLIRRGVHDKVGGYDEGLKDGLEDWDFWLKCADAGYWGNNVREYLNWYRRRKDHSDRWANFTPRIKDDDAAGILKNKYPNLWKGSFPQLVNNENQIKKLPEELSKINNILTKNNDRITIILNSLDNDLEFKIIYNLTRRLIDLNYEISIIVVNESSLSKLSQLSCFTPDVFILQNFLNINQYYNFIAYFLNSRQVDILLLFNCAEFLQLTPLLKRYKPGAEIIFAISDDNTNNLDCTINSINKYFSFLDSIHLINSTPILLESSKSVDTNKVRRAHIVDTAYWKPDQVSRNEVRSELNIDAKDIVVISYFGQDLVNIKPLVLLNVFSQLSGRIPNLQFIIAGEGVYSQWLFYKKEFNTIQDRCRILSVTNDFILKRLFTASDIFFSPNEANNSENIILKAMSCGLYIVGVNKNYDYEIASDNYSSFIEYTNELEETNKFISIISEFIKNNKITTESSNIRANLLSRYSVSTMNDVLINRIKQRKEDNVNTIGIAENYNNIYSDIEKINENMLTDLRSANTNHYSFVDNLKTSIYKSDMLNLKYQRGIEFWQQNSQQWQDNAALSNQRLENISNNIFVRILKKIGLVKE